MRRLVVIAGIVAVLAGCAGAAPSQSREEFVQNRLRGAPFSMVDSHLSKRRFDDVVNSLKRRTAECFNVDVTTRRTSGGATTMNVKDEYRTTVRKVSAERAELTTQYTSKGMVSLQKVPEGGFYYRAVDIEKITANSTKLTYYGPSIDSGKRAWAAMKQWGDGQPAACP